MKRLLFAAALDITTLPALATDVGVSISIGQPGFCGQIDIGGYPSPQMVYSAPRVMYQSAMYRPPIHMNVPAGQTKNWRKHGRHYNACSERVYFVQNNWYEREYVSRTTRNNMAIAGATIGTIIAASRTATRARSKAKAVVTRGNPSP